MKLSIGIAALLAAYPCHAFVPSSSYQPKPTALQAKGSSEIITGTAAVLFGLFGLSTQASAADNTISFPQPSLTSSSIVQSSAKVDGGESYFTLPSYDSAKENNFIDLSSEVETVNKKTQASAKAKREYVDTSAEKAEMDKLRRIEKEESLLFDSLTKQSEVERKARIEAEKAESRANRWNTF